MDMIERVARAIAPDAWGNFDGFCAMKAFDAQECADELERSPTLQASLDMARAAIGAMKEPTEAMTEAAIAEMQRQEIVFDEYSPPIYPAKVFRTMIDAALTPAPVEGA